MGLALQFPLSLSAPPASPGQQRGQLHTPQTPTAHTPGVWSEARANTWWSGTSRWEGGAGQSRLNQSLTRLHLQTGGRGPVLPEAHPAPRLTVNGSPASRSDQPRAREIPRTELPHLDARGSLSFDPHPIDLLARSCLLTEGVATPETAQPLPQPPSPVGEQVEALSTAPRTSPTPTSQSETGRARQPSSPPAHSPSPSRNRLGGNIFVLPLPHQELPGLGK